MSTRSVIAEPYGYTWRGRYHHSDGYPSGLGAELWRLRTDQFAGDLSAMRQVLIHDHPGGWSCILAADWSVAPGYGSLGPRCYCHGERHEDEMPLRVCRCPGDPSDCDPLFIEWAWVLADSGLLVLASRRDSDGEYRHHHLGLFPWDGPEPDWEQLGAARWPEEQE